MLTINTSTGVVAIQAEVLRAQLTGDARRYGIVRRHRTFFIMDGNDICCVVPNDKFLLNYEKLRRYRMLRMEMYDELYSKAVKLQKLHRAKQINGSKYAVFLLGKTPLFVPTERLRYFEWSGDNFYAVDEFSPIFIAKNTRKGKPPFNSTKGFVQPVQVSGFNFD